jgi:hypothetical protein
MGRQRNPVVTARIEQVVKSWNKGDKLMREIAADLGLTLHVAMHDLSVARQRGLQVRNSIYPRKSETSRLRSRVVNAFNRGLTQAQIGERFGITRGAVGRLIAEARAMGKRVITYTTAETSQRQQASIAQRRRLIENEPVAGPPPE